MAFLGLTFKAGTDDVRDSPAMAVLVALLKSFNVIECYDPMARTDLPTPAKRVDSMSDALRDADVLAVLTEWPEFMSLEPQKCRSLMRGRVIVDGRYILDPKKFGVVGVTVRSVGRPFISTEASLT